MPAHTPQRISNRSQSARGGKGCWLCRPSPVVVDSGTASYQCGSIPARSGRAREIVLGQGMEQMPLCIGHSLLLLRNQFAWGGATTECIKERSFLLIFCWMIFGWFLLLDCVPARICLRVCKSTMDQFGSNLINWQNNPSYSHVVSL